MLAQSAELALLVLTVQRDGAEELEPVNRGNVTMLHDVVAPEA